MSIPAQSSQGTAHHRARAWVCSLTLVAAAVTATAHADTRIEVLDTYPEGDEVVLNRNQTFYVHLHYSTDHPIRIWVHPYFHGQPAHTGTNGSYTYTDSGEALGWFFMMSNRGEVDEIRVVTDEGSSDGTVVLSLPVHITGSERVGSSEPEPEWLTRLRARDAEQQRQAYQRYMNRPVSPVTSVIVSLMMWVMLALGVCGFVIPIRVLMRWRGGWRMAATVPAALMGFVVLRLVVGVSRDPTSHNLWPFEILMAGGLTVLIMVVLTLLRKISGASSSDPPPDGGTAA